jgi:hypothetical protein
VAQTYFGAAVMASEHAAMQAKYSLFVEIWNFVKSTKGAIALNTELKKIYPSVTARCSYNPS